MITYFTYTSELSHTVQKIFVIIAKVTAEVILVAVILTAVLRP